LAALIGAAGAILAAVLGHRFGQEQGAERQAALERQLAASSAKVDDLRQALEGQAKQLERLEKAKAKPPVVVSGGSGNELEDQEERKEQRTKAPPEPTPPEPTPPPRRVLQSETRGDFRFNLYGCQRSGHTVNCSLTVTNVSADDQTKTNLCSSYIVDGANKTQKTTVRFDKGGCRIFRLVPDLEMSFQVSAGVPLDSHDITIVLSDGSWGTFSGSVAFRSVKLS
jgi:hypothetical protein